jgi:hypothetical protein
MVKTQNCASHADDSVPLTLTEIVVKALGARYPVTVARMIPAGCQDIPSAVASLRQRMPHWFEAADLSRTAQ